MDSLKIFCVLAMVLMLVGSCIGDDQAGLTVVDGKLFKDGKEFRGIGVNYIDAFIRTLRDKKDISYRQGFEVLGEYKIPFARIAACPFYPAEYNLYFVNKEKYFEKLDDVVKAAADKNVGLIMSLFWYHPAVPDLVREPVDQWGNLESKTHEFMRQYVKEVVSRYKDSPAVWGWELGNEYNLAADLLDYAEINRPKVAVKRGTPVVRSERDELDRAMVRTAFVEFAK